MDKDLKLIKVKNKLILYLKSLRDIKNFNLKRPQP